MPTMKPGDLVVVHNTPATEPARFVGVLIEETGPDVWTIAAMQSNGNQLVALSGVPYGTEPNDFYAWEPAGSGEYTPALTLVDNVAGATALPAFFSRVGDVVTVHGAVNVQASSPGTPLTLRVALPVPSALVTADHLAGVGSAPATTIRAHGTSDTAELVVPSGPGSSTLVTFSFAYRLRAA